MLLWFAYNFLVLLTSLSVILEKSYGMNIGVLAALAWIILPITVVLIIQWLAHIQWAVIDGLIILMSLLIVLEKTFAISLDFLSPIAWIVAVIMVILIAKDLLFKKIKR